MKSITKKTSSLVLVLAFATFAVGVFQNCGDGFQPTGLDNSSNVFDTTPCLENENAQTCVVNKNSVYDKKETSFAVGPDYGGLFLKPVELQILDDSGYLQNDTFRVFSYSGRQVNTKEIPLKFDFETDNGDKLAQLTTYHYATQALGFSSAKNLSLRTYKINLITHAPVTGWSSEDNSIYLGLNPATGHNSGLDASLILQLVAEANIYYASQGRIDETNNSNIHKDCQGKKRMCCTHPTGCSKAISIGLADYFAASFFPKAPTIGETYANNLNGMGSCGISRHLDENKEMSVQQAFHACDEKGYVYPLATVYASIWWNVAQQIKERSGDDKVEFQNFYLDFLTRLRGDMNFVDSFQAIRILDAQSYQSRFTKYFRSEFAKRGLPTQ